MVDRATKPGLFVGATGGRPAPSLLGWRELHSASNGAASSPTTLASESAGSINPNDLSAGERRATAGRPYSRAAPVIRPSRVLPWP